MSQATNLKTQAELYWRRILWETAETGQPSQNHFDDAVYAQNGLPELLGTRFYADLVEKLIAEPDKRQIQILARDLLDALFPYKCRCRRHSELDRDILEFSSPNIYRSLYFSDDSVTRSMIVLFNRTPEVRLLQCAECEDIWLHALDQVDWVQHLVFIEPEDLDKIANEGIWPNRLDHCEDAWVKAFGIVGRNSPNLKEWQAQHNSPEAIKKFGK